MRVAVYVPLVLSVLLGIGGPHVTGRLPPHTAVPLVSIAAFVTALATGFSLAVLGFTMVGQIPALAVFGDWSTVVLRRLDPVPAPVATAAGATVVALLAMSLRRATVAARTLVAASRACRLFGPDGGGLVVVENDSADAYALPALPSLRALPRRRAAANRPSGRMVVSSAMLAALTPPERRVLLAHEAAHLDRHHHLYLLAVELAAAANPALRSLVPALRLAVERWADEDAAAAVGSRRLAARALARAGIARSAAVPSTTTGLSAKLSGVALPAADTGVAERALALLAAPAPARRGLALAVAAMTLVSLGASIDAGRDTEALFEHAQLSAQSLR
jgi:Zn-dependent protease with chaperone function